MALKDLREYLDLLENNSCLKKVSYEVSPILEIPEILRRVMYKKGPAVVFENVKDYPGWRVAGNLFCSTEILKKAYGVKKLEEIGERLIKPALEPPSTNLTGKIKALGEVIGFGRYTPKKVRKGPVFEQEMNDSNLLQFPAFKSWPEDGGTYFTYPLVLTQDPERKITNIGVYRVMILDEKRGVIHWQLHKRGKMAFDKSREMGKRMKVAIILGGDPGLLLTGASPVPFPFDKLLFAGIIRGEGIEVVEIDGLPIPARAEAVLIGYVDPQDLHPEGPFGDHFGYYDAPKDLYPVFHLEKVFMRKHPIYFGSVVGLPPLEDAVIGKAIERIFLPILRMLFPEVKEVNLPEYGMFHGLAIVSIKKRYPGHAKKVMMGLWGTGQFSLTKTIIVVDEDVDPNNLNDVIFAVSANVDPQRDVMILPNTHADVLDPSTKFAGFGSKMGIDATRKFREEAGKDWPKMVEIDEETKRRIDEIWEKLGI